MVNGTFRFSMIGSFDLRNRARGFRTIALDPTGTKKKVKE
jgi:hypothetical protein